MSTPTQVARALAELVPGWDGAVRALHQLGDGPTNQVWLLEHDDARYVLRLVKPLARKLGLRLATELKILHAVAAHDLAPPVVAASDEHGFVLSQYVDGRTWSPADMHNPEQLGRLAQLLRAIHRVPAAAPVFDIAYSLRQYATLCPDARARRWVDDALTTMTVLAPRRPVLCHNDPIANNILDDGDLHLIDWEYAATGDPLFDLAVVVAHHQLDPSLSQQFLQAYLGHTDAAAHADMQRWRFIYDRLVALWLSALAQDEDTQLSAAQTTQLQDLRKRLS